MIKELMKCIREPSYIRLNGFFATGLCASICLYPHTRKQTIPLESFIFKFNKTCHKAPPFTLFHPPRQATVHSQNPSLKPSGYTTGHFYNKPIPAYKNTLFPFYPS